MSTVLLYLSPLSQEGEVREGSLNPYSATVNQMHQDAGFRRPALGHYVDCFQRQRNTSPSRVYCTLLLLVQSSGYRRSPTSIARVI
jgi:hypothetical protein